MNDALTQNIWQPTKGPSDLSIADVAVTSDNILVVSAVNSGVYFSNDHGGSWVKRNLGLYSANSYASSLAAGPDGIVYAIIDDELYRMESGSLEWDKTIYKFQNAHLQANQNGSIFIISDYITLNILVSWDKGNTFKSILRNSNINILGNYSFNGNNNNYFIASESGGDIVYRISDDGSEIKKIYTLNIPFVEIVWHPSGYLFISDPFDGMLRMDSMGKNVKKLISKVGFVNVLMVKPDATLALFSSDGDFESTDLGNNWVLKNTNVFERAQRGSRVLFESDNVYVTGSDCVELFKTNDGGLSWLSFDKDFSNPIIYELYRNFEDKLIVNTCFDANYSYSDDKGEHWKEINLPNNNEQFANLISTANGKMFIKSYFKLYVSNDFGQTWKESQISGMSQLEYMTSDRGNIILAYYQGGAIISTDGGDNWSEVQGLNEIINEIYSHPDGTFFGISRNFRGSVFFSNDQGLNWTDANLQFENLKAFHITRDGTIYFSGYTDFGNEYGTYVSTDKLASWQLVSQEAFEILISDRDNVLYAIEYFDLCKNSTDGGKTWKRFVTGLPAESEAGSLAIDKDQFLYIGLLNDLVYRTVQPVVKGVFVDQSSRKTEVQISPNPVDDFVTLTLADSYFKAKVNLSLKNIEGQVIWKKIMHSNAFKLDLSNTPNGIYFLSFDDPKIPVQKMVVQH